jgi:glycyl-tRNA synthetase
MEYIVKGSTERFIPHVIEPSIGVERLILAVLANAYRQEENRIVLALPEELAPYRFCVSPLLKNKPELVAKAREVYELLRKKYKNVTWDDSGNIGKRYLKQDEIGTPKCVVIDFDTLEDGTVTVRDRDTTEQIRIKPEEI